MHSALAIVLNLVFNWGLSLCIAIILPICVQKMNYMVPDTHNNKRTIEVIRNLTLELAYAQLNRNQVQESVNKCKFKPQMREI